MDQITFFGNFTFIIALTSMILLKINLIIFIFSNFSLNTKIIKCIPKNKSFDMNHLIDDCISKKVSIKIYPLHEYWIDIGLPEKLKEAQLNCDI